MKTIAAIFSVILLGTVFAQTDNEYIQEPDQFSKPHHHIINVVDPSGTVKGAGWPWPDQSFYKEQIDFLLNNGGGVLEVFSMGNAIPNPLRMKIQGMVEVPSVYAGEQAVRDARKKNEAIAIANEENIERFLNQLDAILNAKPVKPNDWTYAESALKAVAKSARVPIYDGHHLSVLIYSDLLDDTPQGPKHPVSKGVIEDLNKLNGEIVLCSHVNNEATDKLKAVHVASFQDFNGLLTSGKH